MVVAAAKVAAMRHSRSNPLSIAELHLTSMGYHLASGCAYQYGVREPGSGSGAGQERLPSWSPGACGLPFGDITAQNFLMQIRPLMQAAFHNQHT